MHTATAERTAHAVIDELREYQAQTGRKPYLERIKRLHEALTFNRSISYYSTWSDDDVKLVIDAIKRDLPRKRTPKSAALRTPLRIHHAPAAIDPGLSRFAERLPHRPYVSNDLSAGLQIASREAADLYRYIQHNAPMRRSWMVFDCDYAGALERVQDQGLPLPNFVARNPANGHSHLFYGLQAPVCTSDLGKRRKPFWLLQRIEYALGQALSGDGGYMGLICKNLLNEHWQVEAPRSELWGLLDFQEHITLPKSLPKKAAMLGVGRNVTLFHSVRAEAYKQVLAFRLAGNFEAFYQSVISYAQTVNSGFPQPLYWPEVRSVAKSVARWTWRHYTGRVSDEEFSAIQSRRGKLGGRPGLGQPWLELGISRATYFRKQAAGEFGTKAISDNSAKTLRKGLPGQPR